MKRSRAPTLPRYLAAHAALGAVIGGFLAAAILGTDVLGLRPLVARDPIVVAVVPFFTGLFALAAAATALALLGAKGGEGIPVHGAGPPDPRPGPRLAASPIRARRHPHRARVPRISCV